MVITSSTTVYTCIIAVFEGSRLKIGVLGAQISPFLTHNSHTNDTNGINHVVLIVFMLEQVYLAIYTVTTYFIDVSGRKLSVFEGSSP